MRDAMSTTSASYDALREAIVRGDIAPEARLVEAEVSTTFEMSRGAVRTALIRLEEEGLVIREPHRGARVRKVSDDEAVEILQVRAVLEGLAVRLTAERIDEAGPRGCGRCSSATASCSSSGPSGRVGCERRPARSVARAVRARNGAPPHPSAELSDRALPVPHDPHSRTPSGVRRGAHGHRRGRRRRTPDAAEAAMRSHLFNVAQAVQRAVLPGGIDNAARGVL